MSDLQQDGLLILKLYELRREPEMREARAWFVAEFNPVSVQQVVELMLSGFVESSKYRMVTTYWEMSAALVNRGALNEQLFLAANSEHLMIMAKLEPHLEELRLIFREPGYLSELEQLVMRIPDVKALLEKRRRLAVKWQDHLQTERG